MEKEEKSYTAVLVVIIVILLLIVGGQSYAIYTMGRDNIAIPEKLNRAESLFKDKFGPGTNFNKKWMEKFSGKGRFEFMEDFQKQMNSMLQEMQEIFKDFPDAGDLDKDGFSTGIKIRETNDRITVTIKLSSEDNASIKATVRDNVLEIHGERKIESGNGSVSEMRVEQFTRSFTLSPDMDGGKMKTTFRDGFFIVTIPKKNKG